MVDLVVSAPPSMSSSASWKISVTGKGFAVEAGPDPHRHQVVARLGATGLHQLQGLGGEVRRRRLGALRSALVTVQVPGLRHGGLGPPLDLGPDGTVIAHEIADHDGRERRGQVGDHLGVPGGRHRVNELGHHPADVILVAGQRGQPETGRDELALLGVRRIVLVDHGLAHLDEGARPGRRAVQLCVPLDLAHIAMAGHPDDSVHIAVRRGFIAQPPIQGPRVSGVQIGVQQIDRSSVRRCHSIPSRNPGALGPCSRRTVRAGRLDSASTSVNVVPTRRRRIGAVDFGPQVWFSSTSC